MNFSTLNISTVSICKSGKSLKLFNDVKKPLALQSTVLYCPFGVSRFENKWSGMYDYTVSCYTDEDFHSFSEALDKKVAECLTQFTTSELQSTLRQNKDYPKLFRLKLPRDSNGNFNFVIFDKEKNKIKVTEDNIEEVFCKKRLFKCIMQCEKITDWNDKASIQWIITQARYTEQQSKQQSNTESNIQVDSAYNTCLIE